MASYTRIVFSQEVFNNEMRKLCDEALNDAIKVVQGNEWFRGSTAEYIEKENFDSYAQLEANHLKAWIVEYGMGKDAEFWRNPYWEDYVRNSGLTNYWRLTDPRIRNRGRSPNGNETINFDKNEKETISGADPAGRLLDDDEQEAYSFEAEPFLQELLEAALQEFISSFNYKMQSFDCANCFITTTEYV